jgi:hypothetical protein
VTQCQRGTERRGELEIWAPHIRSTSMCSQLDHVCIHTTRSETKFINNLKIAFLKLEDLDDILCQA